MKKGDWFFMRQQEAVDRWIDMSRDRFNMVCALWGMGPLMTKRERRIYPTLEALEILRFKEGW